MTEPRIVAWALFSPPRYRFVRLRNTFFRLRHPRGGDGYKRVTLR